MKPTAKGKPEKAETKRIVIKDLKAKKDPKGGGGPSSSSH